jgi:hypothetical protein
MRLRYERGALRDLDEIFFHIAQDNREAAGRLVASNRWRRLLPNHLTWVRQLVNRGFDDFLSETI